MRNYRFYKEEGDWFIDLPEYLEEECGTVADLQMVAGADTLLEHLSQGKDEVFIVFANQFFDGYNLLLIKIGDPGKEEWMTEISSGAFYEAAYHSPKIIWLCDVVKYVFNGEFPNQIFCRV